MTTATITHPMRATAGVWPGSPPPCARRPASCPARGRRRRAPRRRRQLPAAEPGDVGRRSPRRRARPAHAPCRRGRRSTAGCAPGRARRSRCSRGFFGVLVGTEAVHYTREVGPSGDDYTGLLSIPAGLVLVGLGLVTLWRSRRRDDRLLVALRPAGLLARRRLRRRERRALDRFDRLRRHARAPGPRAGGRPRRAVRGGRVHDERRPPARGLVHPRRGTAPP